MILLFCPRKWREKLRQEPPWDQFIGYGSWLLATCACFTLAHMYFEKVGLGEALWQMWQTITTIGYGNKPAETLAGRISSVFFGTMGIAFIGVTIGAALSIQSHRQNKRRKGLMSNKGKRGYVVIHYPGPARFARFIREVSATDPEVAICLIDTELLESPSELTSVRNGHFVRGSSLDPQVYDGNHANLKEARRVVVFPQKAGDPVSDGSTRMVVGQVLKYKGHETRVIYMLVDQRNAHLFDDVPAIAVPESISVELMTTECEEQHTAAVISHLLSNASSENIRSFVMSEEFAGVTWKAFQSAAFAEAAKQNLRIIPLGIVRAGETNLCPEPNENLAKGDHLALVAHNGVDWENFQGGVLCRIC